MTDRNLVYKTAGVPRRGVYTQKGEPVAILWSRGRAEDREVGIMFANAFKLYDMLDKVISNMTEFDDNDELPVELRGLRDEGADLLEEIDRAKQ